jgi:hypothetical protein
VAARIGWIIRGQWHLHFAPQQQLSISTGIVARIRRTWHRRQLPELPFDVPGQPAATSDGITGPSCHNGTAATGKNPTIASSNSCENCHSVTVWRPATRVDHSQVSGTCISCHSGTVPISSGFITGKPANHIQTSDPNCASCHSTIAWRPAGFSHAGITSGCFSCHNGNVSTGKGATHLATATPARTATTPPVSRRRKPDHTQVSGTCVSCHSGAVRISTGNACVNLPITSPQQQLPELSHDQCLHSATATTPRSAGPAGFVQCLPQRRAGIGQAQ